MFEYLVSADITFYVYIVHWFALVSLTTCGTNICSHNVTNFGPIPSYCTSHTSTCTTFLWGYHSNILQPHVLIRKPFLHSQNIIDLNDKQVEQFTHKHMEVVTRQIKNSSILFSILWKGWQMLCQHFFTEERFFFSKLNLCL